jgi:hypothetical protein
MKKVAEFLPEIFELLGDQLELDDARWGNTWLERPIEGSDGRFAAKMNEYLVAYKIGEKPIPYLKIMGECVIQIIRQRHPEMWQK